MRMSPRTPAVTSAVRIPGLLREGRAILYLFDEAGDGAQRRHLDHPAGLGPHQRVRPVPDAAHADDRSGFGDEQAPAAGSAQRAQVSLRVHGTSGLRVADASVMPRIITGPTNAPTHMIAPGRQLRNH